MNMGFVNPFARNHCAVIAFTHAAKGDVNSAWRLAKKARAKGLLTKHGTANFVVPNIDWWAGQVGMKVVKMVKYRRLNPHYSTHHRWGGEWKEVRHLQTVERWLKTHRTGTFVVRTRGHAFAVVDGVAMGHYKPKARILTTIRLERAA